MKGLLGLVLVVTSTSAFAQTVPQDFDLRSTIRPGQIVVREGCRERPHFLSWPTTNHPSFVLEMGMGRAELGIVQMESSRLLRRSWTYTRDRNLQEDRQVAGVSLVILSK